MAGRNRPRACSGPPKRDTRPRESTTIISPPRARDPYPSNQPQPHSNLKKNVSTLSIHTPRLQLRSSPRRVAAACIHQRRLAAAPPPATGAAGREDPPPATTTSHCDAAASCRRCPPRRRRPPERRRLRCLHPATCSPTRRPEVLHADLKGSSPLRRRTCSSFLDLFPIFRSPINFASCIFCPY